MTPARRARWLLLAGAALGIGLAVAGLIAPDDGARALGSDEIARVNGVAIARQDYLRALARVSADAVQAPADDTRAHVLERLIDDELLVQRGVALGLVESDAVVRKALASAVIASVVTEASTAQPSDEELHEFFRENAAYFARPGRVRVARIVVTNGADADARLEAALAELDAGSTAAEVQASFGAPGPSLVPDALLPETKLRELLGPTQTGVAFALAAGEHSPPLATDGGRAILVSLEREPGTTPELDAIRPQVEAEWSRRAGERALGEYLADLRSQARISVAPDPRP